MAILFINACARAESRTLALAKSVLGEMTGEITEVKLDLEGMEPLSGELLQKREGLIHAREYGDPMFRYAKQFAEAEEIVIAAPFWDLSFPAMLKIYLEQITVAGITFQYADGRPVGLCKAKSLTYVTTSGGPIFQDFGYTYVKALAKSFYGIEKTKAVRAMNLDVDMISAKDLFTRATVSVVE